jgi:hypothetical protein
MSDLFKDGHILNLRMPSPAAAALSRQLLRLGMSPEEQHVLTEQQDAAGLQAWAQRAGQQLSEEQATHALAEWKACTDSAMAAYPALREQVERDMERYRRARGSQ